MNEDLRQFLDEVRQARLECQALAREAADARQFHTDPSIAAAQVAGFRGVLADFRAAVQTARNQLAGG